MCLPWQLEEEETGVSWLYLTVLLLLLFLPLLLCFLRSRRDNERRVNSGRCLSSLLFSILSLLWRLTKQETGRDTQIYKWKERIKTRSDDACGSSPASMRGMYILCTSALMKDQPKTGTVLSYFSQEEESVAISRGTSLSSDILFLFLFLFSQSLFLSSLQTPPSFCAIITPGFDPKASVSLSLFIPSCSWRFFSCSLQLTMRESDKKRGIDQEFTRLSSSEGSSSRSRIPRNEWETNTRKSSQETLFLVLCLLSWKHTFKKTTTRQSTSWT